MSRSAVCEPHTALHMPPPSGDGSLCPSSLPILPTSSMPPRHMPIREAKHTSQACAQRPAPANIARKLACTLALAQHSVPPSPPPQYYLDTQVLPSLMREHKLHAAWAAAGKRYHDSLWKFNYSTDRDLRYSAISKNQVRCMCVCMGGIDGTPACSHAPPVQDGWGGLHACSVHGRVGARTAGAGAGRMGKQCPP